MTREMVIGLLVFLLALARSMADGVGLVDESWFLQVVARLRSGDVLYRDVFLGVTPLSAYVTTAVTLVTGIEVVAVKIVTNACFAITTVLSGRLARRAGLSAGASLAVMAAMFVWGRPYNSPPYTPMAMMFFVAALGAGLSAAAAGRPAPTRYVAVGAGLLAGFAFGSKQNIGLLALAAVWAAIAAGGWSERRQAWRLAGWSSTAFAAAALIAIAPAAVTGGLRGLWDFGFAAKGAYLEVGAVPFARSLTHLVTALASEPSASGLAAALHGGVIVLPVVVLALAVATARRLDRLDWTFVAFAFLATLGAYPRLDRFHMAYAVPVHLVALGRLLPRLRGSFTGRPVRIVAAAALVSIVVVVAAQPFITVAHGSRQALTMEHFRGVLVRPALADEMAVGAVELASAAGGDPVLLLMPDAGFWYLASGTRNPSPFDIPARSAVGTNGVPWLLTQLERREIAQVCLDNQVRGGAALVEVEAFVRQHFEEGQDVGPCTVYRARGNTGW